MSDTKSGFSKLDTEILEEKVVYDGFFKVHLLSLKHRLYKGGWSDVLSREVFHRGEACSAILYDPDHDLIGMVEQFRSGALESEYGPWCLEGVAGMVEKGESPDDVIKRELFEEAGITHSELIPISSYYSTPGGCSEKIHLYCALCDLSDAGGVHGLDEEHEDILLKVFKPEQVFAVMLNSSMNNAATLLGLQWLQLNIESLRR